LNDVTFQATFETINDLSSDDFPVLLQLEYIREPEALNVRNLVDWNKFKGAIIGRIATSLWSKVVDEIIDSIEDQMRGPRLPVK
jgi:hypothetical protein